MKTQTLLLTWALMKWQVSAENDDPFSRIPEDGRLNSTELSRKYGHAADEHNLITPDGYILKLNHICGDYRRPILLLHGALMSSDSFSLRGNNSLAIILARKGYDVWALNLRGNRYSRHHLTLDADEDGEFWDFSLQEMAYYDIPLAIDYILTVTGQKKLPAIGYSKGTTLVYIMGSIKPEYNEKISVFVSLAPVYYLQNTKPFMSFIIEYSPVINKALVMSHNVEFAGYYSLFKYVWDGICTLKGVGYKLCLFDALYQITGEDIEEIEEEFFSVIIGHFPAGTSTKSMAQLGQIGKSKIVGQYDYGPEENEIVYGTITPPSYNISKVTMKVALFVAQNDRISTLEDTEMLRRELPNVVVHHVIERPQFNHLDFVWGRNTHRTLYPRILETLDTYGSKTSDTNANVIEKKYTHD